MIFVLGFLAKMLLPKVVSPVVKLVGCLIYRQIIITIPAIVNNAPYV
jgi:hypothetical protein